MSFDKTCENCGRNQWKDDDGELRALEVCWSDPHGQYRCGACHFKPTRDQLLDKFPPRKSE